MKQEAIDEFSSTIRQELINNYPVTIGDAAENMLTRMTQMHAFITEADAKYSELYFGLLDHHSDLTEGDLDSVLLAETQAHFGV